MERLRRRIRELTDARHSGVKDVRVLIARLNPLLRGWGNYFFTGNATLKFNQIDHYVRQRLGLFLARRRGLRYRHGAIARWSFDWLRGLGLHRLFGTDAILVPRMLDAERSSVSRVPETGMHGLKGGCWRRAR